MASVAATLVAGGATAADSKKSTGQISGDRAAESVRQKAVDDALNSVLAPVVAEQFGLRSASVVKLDLDRTPGMPVSIVLPVDGVDTRVDLVTHSVRSPLHYEVVVPDQNGNLQPMTPGPVRTLRGASIDVPGSRAAGSMLEEGLMMRLEMPDGSTWWLEPVERILPGIADRYVFYRQSDVLDHGGMCGNEQIQPAGKIIHDMEIDLGQFAGGPTQGGSLCIAELACDTDVEYFADYGTVTNTEARINSIINTVNLQYESQTNITHQITTIIVRTSSDPYTSTDAQTRLCQFITEWTNNQQSVQRDVAHLFTGVEIDGGTIGIASDIGNTGICVNQGSCTGGTYGTQGSYCLSQSDFNGNFSCATDLTAHELGHLWGAFHCSCTGNTMNPSITCANSFSAGTINSIISYRDTRTCLSGTCEGGPTPPDNDSCSTPTTIAATSSTTFSNTTATPTAGNADPELPSGSPSCQWQGTPTSVHNTVWFEFTAADTSVEIQTCATTAIQDTIIALYSGSCGNLTELACGEDQCGSSTYMSSICYNGLTPGNTYLIVVGNPGGWSGSTPGTIELDVTSPCPSVGPVAGACCLSNGSCIGPVTSSQCSSQGGTFQGAGSDCGSVTCGPPTGACCFADGSCSETTSSSCSSAGGSYQGDGTGCSPNPCPQPTGACCFSNGSCSIETSADCASAGGTYQGDGTLCSPNPCQVTNGACCFADGTCTVLDASGCSSAGGTYQGDGSSCSPNPCPQPTGSCCLPGGGCSVETAADCGTLGGTYNGDGTDCFDSDGDGAADDCEACPNDPNKTEPGTCGCGVSDADSDGDGTPDCLDGCPNDPNKTDPGDCGCGNSDADSDGDGTPDCNDGCPSDPNKIAPGDCGCGVADVDSDGDGFPDCIDNCPVTFNPTQADCDSDGTGDACDGDPTGACCIGISCVITTACDCTASGGVYQGDEVACGAGVCGTQIENVASSDFSTANGSIASGSYLDTRSQNDVPQVLIEAQSNGNPNRRVSRLSHVWTMEVIAGTSYVFHLDAWHDANGEGDNFVFAYSRDGSSYTNMVTVTKTADNDVEQLYTFPEDVAGTLYIRVRDTDRTQGNRNTERVYIDHMYVVTETGGDDVTPPAPPAGLGATAGDGTVALDWADNGESDLDGYTVYRSTSPGGPYTALTGIIGASDYVDNAVTNGTTYYYVVTASDLVGNESAASAEVVATPTTPGSGPTSVSVGSILVYTVNLGQGFKRGAADVLVLDDQGNPVAGAVVNGTFSGDLNETASATTNASGVATLLTVGSKKGGVTLTFCVDLIGAALPYDQSGNAETCDNN